MDGLIIMENPIKMDDLGVPLFSETSIYLGKLGDFWGQKHVETDAHRLSFKLQWDRITLGLGFSKPISRIFEPGVYNKLNKLNADQSTFSKKKSRASIFQASMTPSGVKQIRAIPRLFRPYLMLCFFCWGSMTHIQHPEKNGPSPNPFSDFYWPPQHPN